MHGVAFQGFLIVLTVWKFAMYSIIVEWRNLWMDWFELFLCVLTRSDTLIQAPWFNIHSSSFKGFLWVLHPLLTFHLHPFPLLKMFLRFIILPHWLVKTGTNMDDDAMDDRTLRSCAQPCLTKAMRLPSKRCVVLPRNSLCFFPFLIQILFNLLLYNQACNFLFLPHQNP